MSIDRYNRQLFECSPIGLALCRMDGQLMDINPAYAKIIGRTVEETLNLSYWDITPKKYIQQEKKQLKSLETTGRYGPYEKEYIHKDGHLVPVRLSGTILEQNGETFIWSSVEDVSEQVKIAEALKLSEQELQQQKIVLEKKNIALKEILEQIGIEKEQMKEDVIANVEKLLLPLIKKLKRRVRQSDQKQIALLEKNIFELTSQFGTHISDHKWKLTPREIELCVLIKQGLSSKEISQMLNLSATTIETHRNHIRKKMGILNKQVNLTSYLQTF